MDLRREKTWAGPLENPEKVDNARRNSALKEMDLDRCKSTLDHTSASLKLMTSDTVYNNYILIFNKSSGSNKVQYLVVDDSRERHHHPLPKLNMVVMTKVKDVTGYRVVVLNNFLYVIGGRHYQSGSYLSHCYRFDPRNNQWLRLASLVKARTRFTATALDRCIYVCGELLHEMFHEQNV